jgi:dTDP-4-amino-4,6-dideoxy-D-galactose acyltransferase
VSLIERLDWDSSFFGFAIGRVRDGIAASQLETAVREADAFDLRCTYLLAPAGDHALLGEAQRNGFVARDVRVELERAVAGHRASMSRLRRGMAADLSRLEPIARESFRGTRFFADEHFSPERSSELYVEWLRKGLRGEGGAVTLLTDDACGFVVCELDRSAATGRITLIAVAREATGRGLGGALLAGAGSLFSDAGLHIARVFTQAHNIEAQRLYQAAGYRTASVSLWLHRWRTDIADES